MSRQPDATILYADNGEPICVVKDGRQFVINTPLALGVFGQAEAVPRIAAKEKEEELEPEIDDDMAAFFDGIDEDQAAAIAKEADERARVERERVEQQARARRIKMLNIAVAVFVVAVYVGWAPLMMVLPFSPRDSVCEQVCGYRVLRPHTTDLGLYTEPTDDMACLCPGTEDAGRWTRVLMTTGVHTPATFPRSRYNGSEPVGDSVIAARDLDPVIEDMAASIVRKQARARIVCMHHMNHTEDRSYNVCVLKRSHGGQILPLFNLDLKGYANESKIVMESSLVCGGDLVAKRRRLAVDIVYTTINRVRMRALIDDEPEALAVQMAWQEMMGIYSCH